MASDFVRFPRTPHLAWLGRVPPRGDKVLSAHDSQEFLAKTVVIEEKVDGVNVGLSIDERGEVRAQNRGQYLSRKNSHSQFSLLFEWISKRRSSLKSHLGQRYILFGEWCYAVHTIHYTALPDWFLAFDIFDRDASRFISTEKRNSLLGKIGVFPVPFIDKGVFDVSSIRKKLGPSRLTNGLAEGLYVRRDDSGWLDGRAKLVRPEFAQAIDSHWSTRSVRPNSVVAFGQGR